MKDISILVIVLIAFFIFTINPDLSFGQLPNGGEESEFNLNGRWTMNGGVEVQIIQITRDGSQVTSKFIEPAECADQTDDSDFTGTIQGSTLEGTATVCGEEDGEETFRTENIELIINEDGTGLSGTWYDSAIKEKKSISYTKMVVILKVDVSPAELSPLSSNPQAQITVTATGDGKPLVGEELEIKACTEKGKAPNIGQADADGHTHKNDMTRQPELICYSTTGRPGPTLQYPADMGSLNSFSPVDATTDKDGKIVIKYYPPESRSGKYYISGKDKITATLKTDPNIKGENFITTKVPGLQAIAGSSNCQGGQGYIFVAQDNHGCLFYGTAQTNTALINIAQQYRQRQIDCEANPGGAPCQVTKRVGGVDQNHVSVINGPPQDMRITAMSLPWGGLLDIGRPDYSFWRPPHSSHNDGKNVDIGFGETQLINNNERLILLRFLIVQNNGDLPVANEGRNPAIPTNHFHIRFPN